MCVGSFVYLSWSTQAFDRTLSDELSNDARFVLDQIQEEEYISFVTYYQKFSHPTLSGISKVRMSPRKMNATTWRTLTGMKFRKDYIIHNLERVILLVELFEWRWKQGWPRKNSVSFRMKWNLFSISQMNNRFRSKGISTNF